MSLNAWSELNDASTSENEVTLCVLNQAPFFFPSIPLSVREMERLPVETLAPADVGALLLSTLPHADQCALIRSRLGDAAGKPVRACWLERPASQGASTFSALMEDGELREGLCLPRPEFATEEDRLGLLDLPRELLVNVLHRLVELEDAVAVVNTCRTLRNVALEAGLKTLTHIDESNRRGRHSACRTLALLNVIGPCVVSVELKFNIPCRKKGRKRQLRKCTEHQLTRQMPNLVSVGLTYGPAALFDQLAALAPLRIISLYGVSLSWKTLKLLQRFPLEELVLTDCKFDAPADQAVVDARLVITLQQVKLCNVDLASLPTSGAGQGVEWQSQFVTFKYFGIGRFRCAERFCSRHLTHLHVYLHLGLDRESNLLELFENADFSLQKLRISITNNDDLEDVLPVAIQRNPELEVLCVIGGRTHGSPLPSSALNGIQCLSRLRFLGIWDRNAVPQGLDAVVSLLSMPNLRFLALRCHHYHFAPTKPLHQRKVQNLLPSLKGLRERIPGCHVCLKRQERITNIRRLSSTRLFIACYCSHENFQRGCSVMDCRECKEVVDAVCCW